MSEAGEIEKPETGAKMQRKRRRHAVSEAQRKDIAERVVKLYHTENQNRQKGRAARLQRYAKYRMWTEGTDWPWNDASDVAVPDMLQDSLRVQDTLHNAVMSQGSPVVSKATKQIDAEKEKNVDNLLKHQFFRENPGEKFIGDLAESFCNDPSATAFVPWVRERKPISEIEIYPPLPEDADPAGRFMQMVRDRYPKARRIDQRAGGWEYTVTLADDEKPFDVCFYTTEDDEIEMVVESVATVFDGPCPMVKDYDDVLYPARSANLQPPGPSNPGGAPYVILRDFPIVNEIASLQKSGYYDLLTKKELEEITAASGSAHVDTPTQDQKDKLAGTTEKPGKPEDKSHTKLTRLICLDTYDIDGDGIGEDVVAWVILETKTTLRVRPLGDISPGSPPRRPLFGGSFLPVGGRNDGMCLLEIMEPIHDAVKVIMDQGINANDLAIASPGYYRPSGGMNPEELRIEPFTLTPLQNPQQDVVFPQIGNPSAMGFSLNMISMLGMMQDKVTMVSDLNMGQVPGGSSSALRTIGGMSLVMGQGEARPERILRRFFMILTDVFSHMHRLNKAYLPKGKQFRIVGFVPDGKDPYVTLDTDEKFHGEFDFTFDANAFNTSKAALQQSLMSVAKILINPLMLQLGVTTPEKVYNLVADTVAAFGQNTNRYVAAPTPEAAMPRLLAEEAITEIMRNQMPVGGPLEAGGYQEHMAKLQAYAESDNFGLLTEAQVDLFRQYVLAVSEKVAADAQRQQMMANAGQFAQNMTQAGPGAPVTNPAQITQQPPPVSGAAELQDESLPGAGGGANNGA